MAPETLTLRAFTQRATNDEFALTTAPAHLPNITLLSAVFPINPARAALTLKTREILSVVPIKFVPATVPALPRSSHDVDDVGVCQLARPAASEVRTFPTPGVPHDIFTVPLTSNIADGA